MISFIMGYLLGQSTTHQPKDSFASETVGGLWDLCVEHPRMAKFVAYSVLLWMLVINPVSYYGWRTEHQTKNDFQMREIDVMIARNSSK